MEKEWKKVKIQGIAGIDKCVGEFEVWGVEKIPYPKFKVKVFDSSKGEKYTGYTNLSVIDKTEYYCSAVGNGNTISEALEDTIKNFINSINDIKDINKNCFEYMDCCDF